MYSDYHMHTEFSVDSVLPMEELIERAIDINLAEICFTEHVDYGVNKPEQNCDYKKSYEKFLKMKECYKDKITLKWGIEFGVQNHTIEAFQHDAQTYPFDFILLSIHQVNDQEFWTQDYQKGKSQCEFHRGYYQELLNVIKVYKDYSVLSHMDLMRRYDKIGHLPFGHVEDLVEKILKQVIADGKGIEVNTSSYRYQIGDLTPAREILELYHRLGGTIITIGSDTHKVGDVGVKILEVTDILKDIGFEYHCTFDQRKPIFHKL